MACCTFDDTVDEQFSTQKANQELSRYRQHGAGPTTRLLLDGLSGAGLIDGTVLDIGSGVGSLAFELLDRGCRRAFIVEASAAYVAAASEEAERRGRTAQIEISHGDFVDVVEAIPRATIVTLDRVICCYPLWKPLLDHALSRAERAVALSYPKDRWYVRAVIGWENGVRRWRRKRFRTFVHPESRMRAVIEAAGFRLMARRGSLVWSADLYVRTRDLTGQHTSRTFDLEHSIVPAADNQSRRIADSFRIRTARRLT